MAAFVITAPLLPWDGVGPGVRALAVLAAAAAVAVTAATAWLHARHRAALAAVARADLRLDRQDADLRERHRQEAERERAWRAHAADLSARCAAATAMVDHLVNSQLPAAMDGRAVPPHPAPDALDARLAELRDTALDAAARARRDHCDRLESQRLALVALARRVQTAMHRVQAEAATTAERHRDLPEVYGGCQAVDHIAAQAARLAQGLAVACGTWEGQQWDAPMRLAEAVQAAQGRIEDYRRVGVEGDPDLGIAPAVLEAVIHVLAELLANATESSPTGTPVPVRVSAAAQGAAFRIDDHGAGLEEPRLSLARAVLDGTREVSLADMGEVPRLGLPVVARYARRYDLDVILDRSPHGGLRATVLVPGKSVTPMAAPTSAPLPASDPASAPAPAPTPQEGLPRRVSRRHEDVPLAAPVPIAPPPETPDEAGALMRALLDPGGHPADAPPTGENDDSNRQEGPP